MITDSKSIKEVFTDKRVAAYDRYYREVSKLDEQEARLNYNITTLRKDGIIVLDKSEVDNIKNSHGINMYMVLAAKCKQWNRPYIKCVKAWGRIIVQVTDSDRSLVAHLLLTAEPLKPKLYRTRLFETAERTPDLIEGDNYEFTNAPLASWVTPRTISLLFQNEKGNKLFYEWKEFVTTNRMQRLYLGL